MCDADYRLKKENKSMSEEISETKPEELSAGEIRLRESRSFDAFNEAQELRRKASRERSAMVDADETRRWTTGGADVDGTEKMAENDSSGG
jgi:hypothetical protein